MARPQRTYNGEQQKEVKKAYRASKDVRERTRLLCLRLRIERASWHRSGALVIPENIPLFYLPPATPEMNPIEQIWKEISKRGFRNEFFQTLEKVVDRLCDAMRSLSINTVKSITDRDWIVSACLIAN